VERWIEQQSSAIALLWLTRPHILATQGSEAELVREQPDATAGDATAAVVTVGSRDRWQS